jgi:protein-S-isoprenylcysteine O-methyltransferase Ste14
VVSACALTLAFLRRIRYEEALLGRSLTGYDAYVSRTGKLFPRFFH